MAHYFTIDDLNAYIPSGWVVEALDDDSNGTQDAFSDVQTAAEDAVNAELEGQYEVPFETPSDYPILKRAAVLEAARLCYARRGFDDEKQFKHSKQHQRTWDRLKAIGEGTLPLSPGKGSNSLLSKPRGSVITGPSRTYSPSGSFTS